MVVRQSYHHSTAGHHLVRLRWKELAEAALLYAGVCATLCLAVAWAGGSLDRAPDAVRATITVHAGDTIWSIAKRYGDQRRYILEQVQEIVSINGLRADRSLQEGQRLVVPMPREIAARSGDTRLVCMGNR